MVRAIVIFLKIYVMRLVMHLKGKMQPIEMDRKVRTYILQRSLRFPLTKHILTIQLKE